jgi:hypothetical protein
MPCRPRDRRVEKPELLPFPCEPHRPQGDADRDPHADGYRDLPGRFRAELRAGGGKRRGLTVGILLSGPTLTRVVSGGAGMDKERSGETMKLGAFFRRRHPEYRPFRGSMAGLHTPCQRFTSRRNVRNSCRRRSARRGAARRRRGSLSGDFGMRSSTVPARVCIGIARMTPHIQYHNTTARTTSTGLIVKRLASSIGVTVYPSMTCIKQICSRGREH